MEFGGSPLEPDSSVTLQVALYNEHEVNLRVYNLVGKISFTMEKKMLVCYSYAARFVPANLVTISAERQDVERRIV